MQNVHGPMSFGPTSQEAFIDEWPYIMLAIEIRPIIVASIYRKITPRPG